ncbi:hypothetical protein Tco_0445330 [Tanacetum coccineum]
MTPKINKIAFSTSVIEFLSLTLVKDFLRQALDAGVDHSCNSKVFPLHCRELEEIETINIELDHRVTKRIAENAHLKQTYKQLYDSIKPARIRSKEQCDDLINQVNIKSVEISDLNARLQEKVLVIIALKNDLRKLKGKDLADNVVTKHTIDPEMLKIDVEYLNPRLLNNRSVHSNYIKHTQEEAATLREIVEQGKSQNPLNTSLDSACKYTKQIQELLVLIGQTCPRFNNSSEKLVVVTPKNKDKRVRFTEPVTSSGYTITKTAYTSNIVSNKPMLSSTGVKPSTSASGSQPSGNTKKDKIRQTPSSTQMNKVEAHPRKVKSSFKNKDCVVQPKGTAHVQHSKRNANSELKCVKCNGCMLSDNHDLCVLDFINNVNARKESKSVNKSSKRKVWKPTETNRKGVQKYWIHLETYWLKRLNVRLLQIQECIVQKVKASDAILGEKDCSRIVLDKGNDQGLENQSNTSGDESSRSRNECNDKSTSGDDTDIRPSYDTEPMVEVPYTAEYNVFAVDTQHSEQPECIINTCVVEKVDSNVIPDSPDMCDNEIQTDQNAVECDDERVALANLIANLKLDIDENKKIQKQLKDTTHPLTQELKSTELEKYMTFNDRTVDYDKLERKLNETLGLLAQKEIDIKEGLKLKAYEISVVKEKHDELVKQSLLTKSHYEGLVKEKTKVITDLKLKEEKDIDKMISMEKQLKFLNEIVYKRNQSIQTIHMLAPKGPTFNGRPTFANPMYLKKAQSEKPCLYAIPYDQSDPANRLVPDREETLTLEKESRSKLNKDKNDSFAFVHELKQEMHAFKGRENHFEKEIDELESNKADFSNICLHLNCNAYYLHKVKECECLAQKLSKQTETVSKEVCNELLRSFTKLEKHSISLELGLQQCQEQMKNDTVCKEKASNVFMKEREQYFEIQDLKAQLQDKNISISELKKLIKKNKGKGVDTNFEGTPPLQPIKNQPVMQTDECILKYLSKVNSRASAQKKDAQSHKTTKRYMPVEKKCDSKKHDRQILIGQKFSTNKPSNVYIKTTPPRSGLTWKPTSRIFTQVGLKWIPIRKPVKTHYNTNDSASPLGKETHNPKTVICANSSSLSTSTSMASKPSLQRVNLM